MSLSQLRLRSRFQNSYNSNREPDRNLPTTFSARISPQINRPNDDNDQGEYEPHHEMYDRMRATADRMPVRQPMSGLQKVGSAISRLSGFGPATYDRAGNPLGLSWNQNSAREATDYFENHNFNEKVGDWKQEYARDKDLANEEQQRNASESAQRTKEWQHEVNLSRATNEATHWRNMYDLGQAKDENEKAQLAQRVKESEQKRAESERKGKLADKLFNEGVKYRGVNKQGQVYIIENDGGVKVLDQSEYTEQDKQDMIKRRMIAVDAADAAETRKTDQNKVNIQLNAAKERPLQPTQQAVDRKNALVKMLSEHPEWKNKYIEWDAINNEPSGLVINKGGDQNIVNKINSDLAKKDPLKNVNDKSITTYAANIEQMIKDLISEKYAADRDAAVKILTDRKVIR